MITKTFTNQRDAVNFAHAHHGNVYIEIEHVARGQWVVTITDADLMDDEPTGFTISEIEEECGVTLDKVSQMAGLAHLTDDHGVIFPVSASAALCSATARFLLGERAEFMGLNQLRNPVYRAVR